VVVIFENPMGLTRQLTPYSLESQALPTTLNSPGEALSAELKLTRISE
jgi:hypothetical protein